jgi:orotidine-5'-phosphate decarboxylase
MTEPRAAAYPVQQAKDSIIVALDVATAAEARTIVAELDGVVGTFKVGSQLFTAAGPEFVKELTNGAHRVFLDLKFHDIPNTVANAVVEAARLGVWMVNVHALGGREMMKHAADSLRRISEADGIRRPLLTAVTVLTSSNDDDLRQVGIEATAQEQVIRLASLASECGLDGVVASPLEARSIRSSVDRKDFAIVTPGIRHAATNDDQKRVTTVAEAFANGSTYVVIGRPIVGAADRSAAARLFVEEAEKAIQ